MSLYWIIILFLLGLGVGSFLNVVILRYDPDSSVFSLNKLKGRSKCPNCEKKLEWFELIPLFSFIFQKGRCRNCGDKLTWQYPVVEFVSGLIVAGVPLFLFNFYKIARDSVNIDSVLFGGFAALWVLVFLIWLVIAFIDKEYYIIPNELNFGLGVLGILIVILKTHMSSTLLPFSESFLEHYSFILSPFDGLWVMHGVGALIGALFFVGLIVVSGGRAMGWGDVKFALVSGLILGWPDIGLALALSFVIGGSVGAFYLWKDKKNMGDKLPFGPFLIVGMVLTVFLGVEIIHGYMNIVGF